MPADLNKLVLYSKNNSFKNQNVYRGNITIPTGVGAGAISNTSVTFTVPDGTEFIEIFGFFTSYSYRIEVIGIPLTTYADMWQNLVGTRDSVFLYTSAGIMFGTLSLRVTGNQVFVNLNISRMGMGAMTINHGTYVLPISLVAYSTAGA